MAAQGRGSRDWFEQMLTRIIGERRAERGRADIASIYRLAVRQGLTTRNPVIVIPGVMGSRLVASRAARQVWGDFRKNPVKPASPERVIVSINNALNLTVLKGEVSRLKRRRDGSLAARPKRRQSQTRRRRHRHRRTRHQARRRL